MLKLKTKTEFEAPGDRKNVQTIIRLIVDQSTIDINNFVPKGYYYYNDENGKIVQRQINALKQWEDIEQVELTLPKLISDTHLRANMLQRLEEFTFLQLMMEAGLNFGTVANDWEVDND